MDKRSITLRIKSHPKNVALVGIAVRGYCETFFEREMSTEVELAVVEALNNVIEHGYKGGIGHNILIRVEIRSKQFICQIRDYGRTWDDYAAKDSLDLGNSLEELPEGGYGLFILHQVMDSVHHEPKNPGNLLVLKRFCHPEQEDGNDP